jgi:PAS domain S-box-containing protein
LLDALTQELAAARAVTRATLESTADAVLVTDPRGRVTLFNEKFLALWGLERADVEGARHADLVRRAAPRLRDAQAVARRVATLHAAAGDDALGETSDLLETRDGQVLERCSQVRRLDGREIGRVWRYRDVTAQVRSEDALRDEAGVLHFLNRIGATIAATPDLSTLLQTAVDAATEVSGAAFGAFFYRDDMGAMPGADGEAGTRGGVPMLALAGVSQPAPDEFGSLRTAALFGAAWGEGRTVRCDDVTAAARYGATASDFGVGVGDGDGDGDGGLFAAAPAAPRAV